MPSARPNAEILKPVSSLNNLAQQTLVDLGFIVISNNQSHLFAATQKLASNGEFNTMLALHGSQWSRARFDWNEKID